MTIGRWRQCLKLSQTSTQSDRSLPSSWDRPLEVRRGSTSLSLRGLRPWGSWATDSSTYTRMMHNAFYDTPLALPKVLYTLRTSPCFQSPSQQSFDLLRALLGDIANINITENDLAWCQASLPVWSGGLGVRSGTQLAPSAFLASAAGCTDVIRLLLPPRLRDAPIKLIRLPWEPGVWDMKNHPHWLLTTLAKKRGTPPWLKPLSKQSKQQPQTPLREPISLQPAGRSQGHGFTPCQCQRWGCTWTTRSCAWLWDCTWVRLYAIHMNAISVEQE